MRTALALFAAVVLLTLLAVPQRAHAEDSDDPAILLRRARVADEVEKDPKQAHVLYARVWELAPQTPLGLHAGLRLSQLLEDDPGVLDLLKDLTKRHTARMSDAQKQQVHDAIVARLQPGENTMTPLGIVYMGRLDAAQDVSQRSPVERKLEQIFKVHQVRMLPFRKNNSAARRDLQRELEALGEPGRLALTRMVDEGQPDEAFSAAILLHDSEPEIALRGYARAIRTGRAEFRLRVIRAAKFEKSPELSPKVIETLLPLLEVEHIQDIHPTVVARVAEHMTDEQLLAKCKDDGQKWVVYALSREVPGAFAWVTNQAASSDPTGWYAKALANAIPNHLTDSVDSETVSAMFALFLDGLEAGDAYTSIRHDVWRRLAQALHKQDAWNPTRRAVWRRTFETDDAAIRNRLLKVAGLFRQRGDPRGLPQDFFQTEADWARLASLVPLPSLQRSPWMKTSVPLWRALLERLRTAEPNWSESIEADVRDLLGTDVPDSLRPACLAFVEQLDHAGSSSDAPVWVWEAAGATADPRLLKHIEENLEHLRGHNSVGKALIVYQASGGKGIVAFCKRVLAHPYGGLDHWALTALHRSKDPAAWDHLVSVSNTPSLRYSIGALLDASDPRQRALLVTYFEQAARGEWSGKRQSSARDLLVHRAQKYRLREAVPFLLREYEAQAPNHEQHRKVAAALDVIREHHERLAFFKSWDHHGEDASKVLGLLDDGDAAIRRAAVMSLAALQGSRALPRLLEIAKNDKDEGVRKAALEAIERVATEKQE